MYEGLIHTEEKDGFTIGFYACEEDISLIGQLATGDDEAEIIRKIESGDLLWFCARVTASKAGIKLGSDYLGCCCYKSYDDFMEDGCYSDMVNMAIDIAKAKLKELCNRGVA